MKDCQLALAPQRNNRLGGLVVKIGKFKFIAVTLVVLSLLASCGGGAGGRGSEDPSASFKFESLYGEPGVISFAQAPPRDTPAPPFAGWAVVLYKVFQTDTEATTLKAHLSNPLRTVLERDKLLLLVQSDYFSRKSLVTFDVHTMALRNGKFRVTRLQELPDRIEVDVEACNDSSWDSMEDSPGVTMGYFAIAKTNKPVVLLPLQFSPLPPLQQYSIGACPAKK